MGVGRGEPAQSLNTRTQENVQCRFPFDDNLFLSGDIRDRVQKLSEICPKLLLSCCLTIGKLDNLVQLRHLSSGTGAAADERDRRDCRVAEIVAASSCSNNRTSLNIQAHSQRGGMGEYPPSWIKRNYFAPEFQTPLPFNWCHMPDVATEALQTSENVQFQR